MTSLHLYDVIRRPIVSEKTNLLSENNQYVFEVATGANKVQIKEAVSAIFGVSVVKVNTMVMPYKRGRRGRKFYRRTQQWKKAVVTLAEGDKIDLFEV
ncbi:MAG: 50S ribosomal protein L23 [Anaerolineae bacterium]|jgi:large subunit ribosomal protein L23|nr:50S ribosomal protein L23 [Anaerolineae bacterium]